MNLVSNVICILHLAAILKVTGGQLMASMASEFKFDLRFEISKLDYPISICILPFNSHPGASEAMAASAWTPWHQRSNMISESKSGTLIILVSRCIWPLTAILWPLRPQNPPYSLRGHMWPPIPMVPCFSGL